jgi:hypothetical protein
VSSATGGLLPGVNLDRVSALEEIDDLERLEKLKRLYRHPLQDALKGSATARSDVDLTKPTDPNWGADD